MQTQVELELSTYGFGKERAAHRIGKREQAGQADENPYAQAVYRKFVLPLAEAIGETAVVKKGRGRKSEWSLLLKTLEPEPTAWVVVRAALVHLLGKKSSNCRVLIASVGEAAYHELLLANFDTLNPDLFNKLTKGLSKKLSLGEEYRLKVYKDKAAAAGLELPEWSMPDIERVGAWMVNELGELGMLEVSTVKVGSKEDVLEVHMSPSMVELVESIKELVVENSPYFLPCVEEPRPWVSYDDGGWHTDEMRRLMPYCIKTHAGARHLLEGKDISQELTAINALQSTRWRINQDMYNALQSMAGKVDMKEVMLQGEDSRPEAPGWYLAGTPKDELTEEQLKELKAWYKIKAQWEAQAKEKINKWARYKNAMGVAKKFLDYPNLYFVYFSDFRGRKYALTTGVSPQGSDLQKALLHFAKGKPLHTAGAKRWFKITGANHFGYDKDSLEGRIAWVDKFHDQIVAAAEHPERGAWWLQASKPLQFLAWCFEYRAWKKDPDGFLSHLSASMDGSCNGLQNFSAMLRDSIGGLATNLVPSTMPKDLYGMVAKATQELLEDAPDDLDGFRSKWVSHGINRKVVKRSCMTVAYASTRYSCAEFVLKDYLMAGLAPEFSFDEYGKAARYLSMFIWKAIGDVVVKAMEAMGWLQGLATEAIKDGQDNVLWTTPTGFPVAQVYYEDRVHRINTKLCGRKSLYVRTETSKPDRRRHKNGISPNFIHSLDASHLTMVANACKVAGISDLHMIHDSFGTHCADAPDMFRIIRDEFVKMYEGSNPLQKLHQSYPHLVGPPPALGTLDIRQVLHSEFFFS